MKDKEILNSVLPYLQFIHDYHQDTVNQGKAFQKSNGEITTVYSTGIPYNGKIYEVPGYDRETGKFMNEDEVAEKYIPMLESGELQKKYGDFGIPEDNYKTIIQLYQKYKKNSDYGNVPKSAIGYYEE